MSTTTEMTKLEKVLDILARFPGIRSWYVEQHGIDISSLTEQSVYCYGTGAHGDLADAILEEKGE